MSETYQALYRKWRPMTFDDVVGQKHVSDTLKNSVASGRITHAYLFCGTRGTGKTSTAKIFSRAVNCENPVNGEPCNECPTCRGILDGSIMDVYEMDAASNRGVDNIREIRDEVMYIPAGCTYKVYIIDEVHMLTTEAFNAILKTLEEPPAHALFILATTEPHKIPATVLSRCQRFDFRRIGVDDIANRLNKICESEGINATPDAVELVAELGDGSMRDALSILDQCAAFGLEKLSTTNVAEIVGVADPKFLFDIAKAVAEGDIKSALTYATECLGKGKEVQNFLEEMTDHLRSLLICKATDNPMDILERTAESAAKYQAQAELFSVEQLMYCIRVLGEAIAQAKWMSTPQIAAEVCLVKLCNPAYSTEPDAILTRIEKLERRMAEGSFVQVTEEIKEIKKDVPKAEESEDTPPWNVPVEEPKAEVQENVEEEKPEIVETVSKVDGEWEYWADALQEIKKESKALFAFLYNAKAYQKGSEIRIELSNKVAHDRIAKPEGLQYLSKLFSRVAGSQLSVSACMEGQMASEDKKQTSIFDLADKKDAFGDVMTIVENSD